jgi:2-keto-4-pentenoate hydratase
MNTTSVSVEELAKRLADAEKNREQIAPLTAGGAFDPATAYAIQLHNANARKAAGEPLVGMKVGLTSQVMQKMLGVDEPDYGHLFEAMRVVDGGTVQTDALLQPRAEAEIAIVLKSALRGPNVTIDDVIAATAYVTASLEIIDSRIKDWKITLADTIADNGSSAMFVLGAGRTPVGAHDLAAIAMEMTKNGEPAGSGLGSAVLGTNPLDAVAWLANTLAEFGTGLEAGAVILPGALSGAIPVAPGDTVRAEFGPLGAVSVTFA